MSNDDARARLIRGLAMAEGFSLHVVISESTRTTDAFLEEATAAIDAAHGAPPVLQRLNPYANWSGIHDAIARQLTIGDLRSSILEPLLAPTGPAGGRRVDIVDASGEISTGARFVHPDHAWGPLFDQLNEARNVIVGAGRRSMILAVPARLEPVLAERAADLWSLRSDDAVLVGERRPQEAAGAGEFAFVLADAIRSQPYYERTDLRELAGQDHPALLNEVTKILLTDGWKGLRDSEHESLRIVHELSTAWSSTRVDWALVDARAAKMISLLGSPAGSESPAFSAPWLLEAMGLLAEEHGEQERAARWAATAAFSHWASWSGGVGHGMSPEILRAIVGTVRTNLSVGALAIVREALGWGRLLLRASPWKLASGGLGDSANVLLPPSHSVRDLARLSREAGDAFRADAYEAFAELLRTGLDPAPTFE